MIFSVVEHASSMWTSVLCEGRARTADAQTRLEALSAPVNTVGYGRGVRYIGVRYTVCGR